MKARLVGPPAPRSRHATLVDALAAAAASAEGLVFCDAREREERLSFRELFERARATAAALVERGVRPGDRVAIVLPTGPWFMDAFFGALLAGAVAVPLYPPVRLGRLDEYHAQTAARLAAAGARVVLTDARVRRLLGIAIERARPDLGCVAVADLRAARATLPSVSADDLALVQFSSGTTVDPKPVALTHANLIAQCAALETTFPTGARNVGVSWLPLYHDMGLVGALLSAVHHPGTLVLIPPEVFLARPALWLRAIARHRATISPAPNFAFGLCVRRVRDEELEGVDLSSWRLATNGAEPISAAVVARFAARFARFGLDPRALTPVYGLAEACLAVTFTEGGRGVRTIAVDPIAVARDGLVREGARSIVSVGRPVAGVEVEVRDDRGEVVDEGRVGRIHVRGPSVMVGYLNRAEATARTLRDGWLDTGDLGFVSDSGAGSELFVCGRAKDVIIVRGANHAPQELEDALDGLDGARPGCAIAVGWTPPHGDGEEVLLFVEHASDAEPAPDLAARASEAVLARTGLAPTVHVVAPGTLPRTSSGKLRRGEALRRFLTGTLAPPRPVTRLGIASEMIRSELAMASVRLDALRAGKPER